MKFARKGHERVAIPGRTRRNQFLVWVAAFVIVTGLGWWSEWDRGALSRDWWRVWPLWAILLPFALLIALRKTKLQPTAQTTAARLAKEAAKRARAEELEGRWWVRYPLSVLFGWFAIYVLSRRPDLWWLALGAGVLAAIQARELALVVLGVVAVAGTAAALAALPISLAIVLAAALIAYGIYRAKHRDAGANLPIVGALLARRHAARSRTELLKNPFFARLDLAVRTYWTDVAEAKGVNAELREMVRSGLVEEGAAVAQAVNPVEENRRRLVDAVNEAAAFAILMLPAPPEPDASGIRGQYGISGALRSHFPALASRHKQLREWLYGFGASPDTDTISDAITTRHWITLARANVLAALREPLNDTHPKLDHDWYKPLFIIACASKEHEFREALGLRSNLAPNPIEAKLEQLKLRLFFNCVLQGAKYPDLEWRDRWLEAERGASASA